MAKAPTIIVRKRRAGHNRHHGGAWKVAYADFVTAMMAFFLVMWIVGQSQPMRAGVAGYFRDPGVLEHQRSTGILPDGRAGIDPEAARGGPGESGAPPVDTTDLQRSAERIREMLRRLPEFSALEGQIEIRLTPEGLRIELIDSDEATFFDMASAELKPATRRVLAVIARELGSLGRPLVVEGHTDSRPYTGAGGYTNWELAADRANAARREMQRSGLPDAIVRAVRGLADKQLAHPDHPLDPRNRRVSILVPIQRGETEKPLI